MVRKTYHRKTVLVLLVGHDSDVPFEQLNRLTADTPFLKDAHGIVHVPRQRLGSIAFGIEHRVQAAQSATIPMVMAVYERHVGEVRHHLADDLPLVSVTSHWFLP